MVRDSLQYAHGAFDGKRNSLGRVTGNMLKEDLLNGRFKVLFMGQRSGGKDKYLKPGTVLYDSSKNHFKLLGVIEGVEMGRSLAHSTIPYTLTIRRCVPLPAHIVANYGPGENADTDNAALEAWRGPGHPVNNVKFIMETFKVPYKAIMNPTTLMTGIGEVRFSQSIPDEVVEHFWPSALEA